MGSTSSDTCDLNDSSVLVGELERVADGLGGQVREPGCSRAIARASGT